MKNEETNNLMNRFEDKYSLHASKLYDFTSKLGQKLKEGDADTSVRHNRNRTIYLDNRDLDSFRDNIEDVKPRFKVRIRQYKPDNQDWEDTAYVELKIKNEDGFTKKVRIRIPAALIPYICEGHEIKAGDYLVNLNMDISKIELWKRTLAINTTIAKYNFKKQLVVEYNRRAYSNKEVRVTIDDSLKYYNFSDIEDGLIDSILESDNWKKNYKNVRKMKANDFFILEVKHGGKAPGWLEDLLDENKAKEVKFSKYSAAVITYIVNGNKPSDSIQRQKINTEELFRTIESVNTLQKKLEDFKDSLNKGYKENILAGALALAPMSMPEQAPKIPLVSTPIIDKATQVKNVYNEVAKRNPILGAIGAHESTKGERYNKHHMTTNPGMHFGHTAGGAWGMMPIDAAELINKDKNLATKYPNMVELTKDVKANHKNITAQLNDNPEMAAVLAEAKLNHNKSKHLTDDELIHSWYHGLTGTLNAKNAGHNISHNSYVKAVKNNLVQNRAPAQVKKSVDEEWGTCKSFNSTLTAEELSKRNMFLDE
ncbi:PolyPPase_VTC_like domain containing protein [uncultured Caudovirales phage]|uniref:PolyPPase_VTC_like domain containing protein n=1 Tax=uncultured Caudovirales phage TaxID=2100421 RepID=A0A6J5KVM0_9CAUD|nr:PolyPPase_VTC_like domain containing protein [uncultured Caudovirales phage]